MSSDLIRIVDEVRQRGLDHDILQRITVIEGVAINETPIRVGKGRGELGEVDIPILRDPSGIPYIPGSSLKGSMRSFIEALARGSGLRVCTPFNSSLCAFGAEFLNYVLQTALTATTVDSLLERVKDERRLGEIARRRIESHEVAEKVVKSIIEKVNDVESLIAVLRDYAPCVACRIFGNPALASRITVFDAYPADPTAVKTVVRTRVAIDRLREAARSGALFEYEFVPRGFEWRIRIEIKNIDLSSDQEESRLLRMLLKHFSDMGIVVGGMKSVGHGVLKLDPERSRVKIYRVRDLSLHLETDTTLREFLR